MELGRCGHRDKADATADRTIGSDDHPRNGTRDRAPGSVGQAIHSRQIRRLRLARAAGQQR